MNIGTHFDHNNHIAFISIHTKIRKCTTNGSEFADLAFSNVVAL